MSDQLTARDLIEGQHLKVSEIELLGKRAYIRELSFDAQASLADLSDGGPGDAKYILALSLCDEHGDLLFADVEDGAMALGAIKAEDLLASFSLVSELNGLDVEEQVKN